MRYRSQYGPPKVDVGWLRYFSFLRESVGHHGGTLLPEPLKSIVNYRAYLKYVRTLDRDELEVLRDSIRRMGINDGIESYRFQRSAQADADRLKLTFRLRGLALAEEERVARETLIYPKVNASTTWRPSARELRTHRLLERSLIGVYEVEVYDCPERNLYGAIAKVQGSTSASIVLDHGYARLRDHIAREFGGKAGYAKGRRDRSTVERVRRNMGFLSDTLDEGDFELF